MGEGKRKRKKNLSATRRRRSISKTMTQEMEEHTYNLETGRSTTEETASGEQVRKMG